MRENAEHTVTVRYIVRDVPDSGEFGTAAGTFTLAVLCLFVAWGRLSGL